MHLLGLAEMKKKVYTQTYGCQMNVYDTEKMVELLSPHGFEPAEHYHGSDIVILNTCHIREKASEKVYSELGRIRSAKEDMARQNRKMIIVVAGCVAQAEGEEIVRRAPFVDVVVGPQAYHNLPRLITEIARTNKWVVDLSFDPKAKFDEISKKEDGETQGRKYRPSEFLSIQEGCDKFCHFCVVSYTRGAEHSRSVPEIYREAVKLANSGVKELTLLGQNVNAYHSMADAVNEPWRLGKLLQLLAKIDGLERLRYTTSHPVDMDDELLFEMHATEPKVMPFLHLPVQSGSNSILQKMNRKHDRDFYLKLIEKFRKFKPDIAFSSDFIVGYPGETDQDFEDTLDLVKTIGYAQCYSFKYSIRPGTPAAMMNNQVPEEVKNERLQILQNLLFQNQEKFNKSTEGKILPVLFEKPGKFSGQILGKSPYMQSVIVDADASYIGGIYDVKILQGHQNSVQGEVLNARKNTA